MSGGEREIHGGSPADQGGGNDGFGGPNIDRLRQMRQQSEQFASVAGNAMSFAEDRSLSPWEIANAIRNTSGR